MGNATTKTTVLSVRADREMLDEFGRVAAANHRSAAQEIRWLMDRHIEEHREREAAA